MEKTLMSKNLFSLVFFGTALFVPNAFSASPASKEYVNCKVNEVKAELEKKISSLCGIPLTIGQKAFGGVVFWVDPTGKSALIAEEFDLPNAFPWEETYRTLGTFADGVTIGLANTQSIKQQTSTSLIAATACTTSSTASYTDWYLPSRTELSLLYQQKVAGIVTNFAAPEDSTAYWSSTEHDGRDFGGGGYSTAWGQNFTNSKGLYLPVGGGGALNKKIPHRVRCIRVQSNQSCASQQLP